MIDRTLLRFIQCGDAGEAMNVNREHLPDILDEARDYTTDAGMKELLALAAAEIRELRDKLADLQKWHQGL